MRATLPAAICAVGLSATLSDAAERVTFSKDIAPILYAHCATCHRPGEIGPFSLLTYRDARQRLTQIADLTRRRVMPPWQPASNNGEFVGDRALSDEQIQRIQDWAAQGAPEGNRGDLPPLPRWPAGWQLGPPDLVVSMEQAFTLPADGADVFRTFVLPIPTPQPRYVRAIELRPGNARAVHHANLGVDRTKSSRRLDAADPAPGYLGGMVQDAAYPTGYMLGWTPGQRPRPSPDGMPWLLEPNSDFVVQLHMQPTGKPESIAPSVALYFTADKPTRTPLGIRLGSGTIEIPAGDPSYEVKDSYVLPVDVEVLAVQPHAHNLARQMEAAALLPDGTARSLIAIKDWDFRWQDVYRYTHPFVLPRGTTISMRFLYDNSTANPRNPSRPPVPVRWGQSTTDEMGDLWLQVATATQRDLMLLAADVGRKTRIEDLAAYTKVMEADPLNPLRHDAVGMLHLQQGNLEDAVNRFKESLRLNNESAPTHYILGLAYSAQRDYVAATREFFDAITLDPNYAEAHNNLGVMLHLRGLFAAATTEYRLALQLKPDNVEARTNLGRMLAIQGRAADAALEFERALTIDPNAVAALFGLAWVRATAADASVRRPDEAVQLAERAADLSARAEPAVLDALAAAYASLQQFERAAETAREAMQRADERGMQALGAEIRDRVRLYEQQLPYVQK